MEQPAHIHKGIIATIKFSRLPIYYNPNEYSREVEFILRSISIFLQSLEMVNSHIRIYLILLHNEQQIMRNHSIVKTS